MCSFSRRGGGGGGWGGGGSGVDALKSLFVLFPVHGSTQADRTLDFYDSSTFSQTKQLRCLKSESSVSDLLSCPHLPAHSANSVRYRKCGSPVFVLARAVVYSYFLMFPVCAAAFPSLLCRPDPRSVWEASRLAFFSHLPTTLVVIKGKW